MIGEGQPFDDRRAGFYQKIEKAAGPGDPGERQDAFAFKRG